MEITAKDVQKRYDRLYSEQAVYRPLLEELATYILPKQSDMLTVSGSKGQKQTRKIYDSTAVDANTKLSAWIHGSLTNPAFKWFTLKIKGAEMADDKEANDWLEDSSNRIFFALQQSNYYSVISEVHRCMPALGCGCSLIEENNIKYPGFNGFKFTSVDIGKGQIAISEGEDGKINTLFRKFELSASEAFKLWGQKVGEKVGKELEKNPDKLFTFLHGIFPRHSVNGNGSSRDMPFASVYIFPDDKHLISESGFPWFPAQFPRWSKIPGEVFGRGPGHDALADIQTCNLAEKMGMEAEAMAIKPPLFQTNQGVIGNVRWNPGGLTTVQNKESFWAYESKARFDVGDKRQEDRRNRIRQIFFNDQMQFSPLSESTGMTPMEVMIRREQMERILGPICLGRYESELLNPQIEVCFAMMMKAKALLPPPQSVIDYSRMTGGTIDIEYEGPLSRAQRAGDIDAINRFFQSTAPLVQFAPDFYDGVDFDQTRKHIAHVSGVPSKLMKSDDQVLVIRQARQEAQEQVEQEAQMAQMADMANKLSPAAKVMGELTGQMSGAGKA